MHLELTQSEAKELYAALFIRLRNLKDWATIAPAEAERAKPKIRLTARTIEKLVRLMENQKK